jgi:hypothetical protein
MLITLSGLSRPKWVYFQRGFMILSEPRKSLLVAVVLAGLLSASGVASARFLVDDTEEIRQPQKQNTEQTAPEKAVEKKTSAEKKTSVLDSALPPDSPRNINASILQGEKNGIQITWEALPEARDPFIVLRSAYIMNTPEAVLNSTPLKVIPADKLRVVLDRNLPPGRYYYAVIPKSKFDERKIQLFPGENYTTNPVAIENGTISGDSRTVVSFKVVTIEDRSTLITWDPVSGFNGEYLIFRSRSIIDTAEKLNKAEPIARLSALKSRYLDADLTPGRYFYALACKTPDGVMYSDLRKDFNFNEDAIFIGGTIGIRGIRAKREGSAVTIIWRVSPDAGNRPFYLLRTATKPFSRASLAGAVIIDTVQSGAERFVDRNVLPGKYYYILAPVTYKDDEFTMIPGVNVTDPAVTVGNKQQQKIERRVPDYREQIPPLSEEKIFQGKSETAVKPDIKSDTKPDILSESDILSKLSEIREPSTDKKKAAAEKTSPVKPGIEQGKASTTDQAEEREKMKRRISEMLKKQIEEGGDDAIPDMIISDGARSLFPDDKEEKQSEEKTDLAIRRTPEIVSPDSEQAYREPDGAVESAINGPFARGEYTKAIRALSRALTGSSSEDGARARLFIARSYIELGRYRDALGYLAHQDVKRYYPKESGFWRDYSIDRLR